MTALEDLDLDVPAIETEADFLDALRDPNLRWFALRRRGALTAAGILGAASFDALHPRGHDGKFIEKWGIVRWFGDDLVWHQGIVRDIAVNPQGVSVIQVVDGKGTNTVFSNPKSLYSRPKPKARMLLPEPYPSANLSGFKKVGPQSGSNPGGFYEITDTTAAMPGSNTAAQSPDIAVGHNMRRPLMLGVAEGGHVGTITPADEMPTTAVAKGMGDVVVVPRIDGTPNRYDVLIRQTGQWYKVPASGSLTKADGTPRTDLVVTDEAAFGTPKSSRRLKLVDDPQGVLTLNLRSDRTVEDTVAIVQQNASAPPHVGDQFYVKTMKVPERARNEALANDLYELGGIAVPEVSVGKDGKTVASKLIGDKVAFDMKNPEHVKAAQDGFVMDAWLANWDAVGKDYDNMLVSPDGTLWRVDAGGALKYRAQGTPKGGNFGPDVGELTSLKNYGLNPQAASVYGSITQAQLEEQAAKLRAITPADISRLAEAWEMPDVVDILIARRKSILDQINPPESPLIAEAEAAEAAEEAEKAHFTGPAAPSVYNPVEQTVQPGKPPEVAVQNYEVALKDLSTYSLNMTDLSDPSVMENAVIVKRGGLWQQESGYDYVYPQATMWARNLITDEKMQFNVYPGDAALAQYSKTESTVSGSTLEDLTDDLKAKYDLAVAEIATSSLNYGTISHAMNDSVWRSQWPEYLDPTQLQVHHLEDLESWIKNGDMKPDGPLYNSNNHKVYEIVGPIEMKPGTVAKTITLRETGTNWEQSYTNDGLANAGPWYRPMNDTADAIYRARLYPAAPPDSVLDKAGQPVKAGDKVNYLGVPLEVQEVNPDLDAVVLTLKSGQTIPVAADAIMKVTDDDLGDGDQLGPTGTLTDTSPYTPDTSTEFVGGVLDTLDDKLQKAVAQQLDEPTKTKAVGEYVAAVNAYNAGQTVTPTPTLDKLSNTEPLVVNPDASATVGEEQADANGTIETAHTAAAPTTPQQIDEDSHVLKSLGPGEPLYTPDMETDEAAWQHLVGTNMIIMPGAIVDNPDNTDKQNDNNGLFTVTSVKKSYPAAKYLNVYGKKGDGSDVYVQIGQSYDKKYLIPVATPPIPMHMVYKQDGTIMQDDRVIGNWYRPYAEGHMGLAWNTPISPELGLSHKGYWRAVINGDASLTGKPIVVYGQAKSDLRYAVFGFTAPVPDKPVKHKSVASKLTEADIAKLKQSYIEEFTPGVTAQVTAEVQGKFVTAPPVGQTPLASGGLPHVGQWVYSAKDNTWWQVTQTDPKLTGKQPGTNIRVRRRTGTTPTGEPIYKESFRGRSTMYAVDGDGKKPKMYLATNVVTLSDGKKVGPGMEAWLPSEGTGGYIIETKGGKLKLRGPDGKISWVEPSNAIYAGSPSAPGAEVVASLSDAELQAKIDAEVNATVAEKVAAAIALDIAIAGPKHKKAAVTYPGPNGAMIKPLGKHVTENYLKSGRTLLADGYAPFVGMVLRDKKGAQWVVMEVGSEYHASQKNKVRVLPAGYMGGSGLPLPSGGKWRTNSTMVVDHEAMLTDQDGKPLPRISSFNHPFMDAADLPDGSIIMARNVQISTYDSKGKYRPKKITRYYAITYDASSGNIGQPTVIDLADGHKMYAGKEIYLDGRRIAVVDKDGGNQMLTITTGEMPNNPGSNAVKGFVIHDPNVDPTALIAGQIAPKAGVAVTPVTPAAQPVTADIKVGTVVQWAGSPHLTTVLEVNGDYVTLDAPSEPSGVIVLSKSEVQPTPKQPTLTSLQGTEIHVGMQTVWGGQPGTISSMNLAEGTVIVEFADGTDAKVFAHNLTLTGQSAAPPGYAPGPMPTSVTSTDGTTYTDGDKVTVNGLEGVITSTYTGYGTDVILEIKYDDGTYGQVSPNVDKVDTNKPTAPVPTGPTPPPTPPTTPTPPPPPTGVLLTGDLPPFLGQVGGELPHPASTQSGAPIEAPKVTGVGAELGQLGALKIPGTHTVMDAVTDVMDRVKQNKASGRNNWAVAYGLGDSDMVEDMLFHTQLLRDKDGNEKVELIFRFGVDAAKQTRDRLLTHQGQTFGDWRSEKIDPKILVPGDQIEVRKSVEVGKETVLKPGETNIPNAVVTTTPVLIGKATTGNITGLDVYRVEVAFSNGETGVIELVSGHPDGFNRYTWDAQKTRSFNGSVGLNPDAKADGWSVLKTQLDYPKGPDSPIDLQPDAAKNMPNGSNSFGVSSSGHMLTRTVDGAEVTYWSSADLNTLDGQVRITVDANDPDAQLKISEAMEAVGLPPDKQGPPNATELAQMALNKVFKQFEPVYERGERSNATPDNPGQVLGMMNTQLKSFMPGKRDITMADISLRTSKDGRVQVLLSEDVATAIASRNGTKLFYHEFIAGGMERLFGVLSGQSPGLLASNERFNSGLFLSGYSSESDHNHDSANRVYLRASKGYGTTANGSFYIVMDPKAIYRHTDFYWQPDDTMGDRPRPNKMVSDNTNWLDLKGMGDRNELMVKRRIEDPLFGGVVVPHVSDKTELIKRLTDWGHPLAPNGGSWEDFIFVGTFNTPSKGETLVPFQFGPEITLPDLLGQAQPGPAVTP